MTGRMPMNQRRQILTDAARLVCKRDGVTSATTRAIATQAQMPLASVHYAFTSREHLIEAVILSCVADHRPEALADLSTAADPEELITAVLEVMSDYAISHPQDCLCRLELVNYALRCGPETPISGRLHQAMLDTLTEILEVVEDKGFRWDVPVAQVAWQVACFHDAVCQSFAITRDAEAVHQLVRITAPVMAAQASRIDA